MTGNIRCIDGRAMRHDPQPDDPSLETDIGKCADCNGRGCICECCGEALSKTWHGVLFCKPCDDAREAGEALPVQSVSTQGELTAMKTITTLLVGAHFRPPAKQVLKHLPAGLLLTLEPEPDNPYDGNALRCYIEPEQIPESELPALAEELPEAGLTLEQLMSSGPIWLGFVAASGGKPLTKAGMKEGNAEVLEALFDPGHEAKLAFGPAGEPWITVRFE